MVRRFWNKAGAGYPVYGNLFILFCFLSDVGQMVKDSSARLVGADHRVTSVNWLWVRQTAKLHHKNICVKFAAITCSTLSNSLYGNIKRNVRKPDQNCMLQSPLIDKIQMNAEINQRVGRLLRMVQTSNESKSHKT